MGVGAGIALRGGLRRALAAAVVLAAGLCLAFPAEAARLLAATGSQPERFGRIALTFDAPVSVKAKLSGTVLVLSYGERASAGRERIAAEMPEYVSTVRRDPDGTGLRLALQRPYRINVQEAGEHVFVDLLPLGWSGLPPPLPPEIVADLARRARAAEAALRAAKPPPAPRPLTVEVAQRPTLTRLSLKLPPGTGSQFATAGPATRLTIPGAWRIDDAAARTRLRPEVGRLSVEGDAEGARLLVTPAAGYEAIPERDDDGVTLDLVKTVPKEQAAPAPKAAARTAAADAPAEAAAPVSEGSASRAEEPQAARISAQGGAATAEAPMATEVAPRRAGSGLAFAFRRQPAAALFERAGIATLVFETQEPVAAPGPGETGLIPLGEPLRTGGFVSLRYRLPPGRLIDLLPVGATGWELVAGETLAASDSLSATRVAGAGGRLGIGVRLPRPGGAVWLDLDGERVAVVTAQGARAAGIPKRQIFVDFELLPSRRGVAVLAGADDLTVKPDLDGVAIGREGGVAVSAVARPAEPTVAETSELAIERGAWEAARRDGVRATLRARFAAAAEAPRAERGPARVGLAKALLANGFAPESIAALTVAAADDPVLAGQREVALLRGIAHALMGREAEARDILSADNLAADPEARLWRGLVDAEAGRFAAADAAFRAASAVRERYPDDLVARLGTAAAEAAIETGDVDSATRHLAAAGSRTADPLTRDRVALLRARIDEAAGRTDSAREAYDRLAREGERPVAAAAALRAASLGRDAGKLTVAEAVDRIETVALTWHGGPLELETIVTLGRLYAEAGRWRDAFTTTLRANAVAPDAAATRALHETAQALFDDLYLGERGKGVSGVEALALYFDFKEFAPAGRRGDEIVRRLADRLVELDLLDSASELLQHQVDHRLVGAARAGVAARLAAIRLMDGKPLLGLAVLEATYLPELPDDLRRARALLRARALSDLSRTELALETIEGETGSDAERLRADILWGARRWREAGEAHEALLGEAWRAGRPLDEAARADVIRAAVAYGLSGEALGQERLKAKFAGPMAESADARTFALLTGANAVRTAGFREIAQRATSAETLAAFLAEYRRRYPDSAVPERAKREGGSETRADARTEAPPPG